MEIKWNENIEPDANRAGALQNSINNINETMQHAEAHLALTQQTMELLNITILQTKSEASKQLQFMNTLTISQMKQLIAKHIGIAESKQRLKHNDIILENHQTISFYDIKDGHTINLYVMADSDVLEINVDYKSGTIKKTIFCSCNIKFIDFRKEVQAKIPNVSLIDQQFFYNDIELNDDEKLLEEYGIINESTLRFEWKSAY